MATLSVGASLGRISTQYNRTADDLIDVEVTLPVGNAVTGWTKTDANTASCTLAGGHGQSSGTYDVYWSTGRRYGLTGTVTSNTLDLDGGAGDDFPASATTGVIAVKQVVINKEIDGDNCKVLGLMYRQSSTSSLGCRVTFYDALSAGGSAVGSGLDLDANIPSITDIEGGDTNLFTGSVIRSLVASNGDSTTAATLVIQGVQDVTP